MARNLSQAARTALFAQETGEVFLVLLEISHTELSEPLRFVYNTQAVVRAGQTFYPAAFKFELPEDAEGRVSSARLSICNIDRRVTEAVRSISGAPSVKVWIVLASNPEQIEVGPYEFTLRNVSYNSKTVSGELSLTGVTDRELPGLRYTPYYFPAMYL